jgi:DnaK suppressor protein
MTNLASELENYMNQEHRVHFTTILRAWRDQLIQESNRTVTHMRDDHSHLADPNDQASQEEEFSIELRAREREHNLLRKINSALQRLASGDYGYCEECGVEIGIERLEARPTADLCIDCKQLEEKKEKGRVFYG